jgi:hypothetical protein
MTTLAARARTWLTLRHFAQLALLIQPLIVLRTAAEYLRLKSAGDASLPDLVQPLFVSLAAVGLVSIVSLLLYFTGRERSVLVLTLAGIVGLIAYKLIAMPSLG